MPSLAMLLAAVAVAFFVIPRLAPAVLMTTSAIVLAIAIYMHISQFGVMEYERSTWQNNFKTYTSLIMVALVIFAGLGYYFMNGSPAPTSFTGPISGGGFDHVIGTAVSRINQLMRKGRITE